MWTLHPKMPVLASEIIQPVQVLVALYLITWLWYLERMWWKERINSYELSSDLRTWPDLWIHTFCGTHAQTHDTHINSHMREHRYAHPLIYVYNQIRVLLLNAGRGVILVFVGFVLYFSSFSSPYLSRIMSYIYLQSLNKVGCLGKFTYPYWELIRLKIEHNKPFWK